MDDLVTDRAEQETGEPAVTPVANHDQISVSRLLEQHFSRLPLDRLAIDTRPPTAAL